MGPARHGSRANPGLPAAKSAVELSSGAGGPKKYEGMDLPCAGSPLQSPEEIEGPFMRSRAAGEESHRSREVQPCLEREEREAGRMIESSPGTSPHFAEKFRSDGLRAKPEVRKCLEML
jgi:hypothetical protein